MIPEVAAVVAAAKAFIACPDRADVQTSETGDALEALTIAVEALEIRETRPLGAVTYEEQDRTWGEVVVGDEILSTKTHKWYEVDRVTLDEKTGNTKVNIKGSSKPITRKMGDPVRVKRGELGDASDTFQLLWSGQFRPEEITTAGAGPMMMETEAGDD